MISFELRLLKLEVFYTWPRVLTAWINRIKLPIQYFHYNPIHHECNYRVHLPVLSVHRIQWKCGGISYIYTWKDTTMIKRKGVHVNSSIQRRWYIVLHSIIMCPGQTVQMLRKISEISVLLFSLLVFIIYWISVSYVSYGNECVYVFRFFFSFCAVFERVLNHLLTLEKGDIRFLI